MLVDNGIVVVENVYRLMDEGKSAIAAAKLGVGEVALAIIASTATPGGVHAAGHLAGFDREFMKYLPSRSLWFELVVVCGAGHQPVLTSVFMRVGRKPSTSAVPTG